MAECFPENLRWCSNEQICQGVKCKTLSTPEDWIRQYIRTYLCNKESYSIFLWLDVPVSVASDVSVSELLHVCGLVSRSLSTARRRPPALWPTTAGVLATSSKDVSLSRVSTKSSMQLQRVTFTRSVLVEVASLCTF